MGIERSDSTDPLCSASSLSLPLSLSLSLSLSIYISLQQADHYSFTLSWSRLLPDGDISRVNEKGVAYYNNLLDSLVSSGVKPVVTLHRWDLPQALQDKGGWLNETTAHRFLDLARLCFSRFGDRVSILSMAGSA